MQTDNDWTTYPNQILQSKKESNCLDLSQLACMVRKRHRAERFSTFCLCLQQYTNHGNANYIQLFT